jgi:hypothetical protein
MRPQVPARFLGHRSTDTRRDLFGIRHGAIACPRAAIPPKIPISVRSYRQITSRTGVFHVKRHWIGEGQVLAVPSASHGAGSGTS